MRSFRPLSPAAFKDEVEHFVWSRRVWRLDLHHSVVPSINSYDGLASIEAIRRNDIERYRADRDTLRDDPGGRRDLHNILPTTRTDPKRPGRVEHSGRGTGDSHTRHDR